DRLVRVLRLQEQELRADQSGHRIIDLAVEEDDALAQEPRIDVEGSLAAGGLFDHHRDELKHVAHRRPPCLQVMKSFAARPPSSGSNWCWPAAAVSRGRRRL